MKKGLLVLGMALATLLPAGSLAAQRRVIVVRPRFGYYGGFYSPWYDPFWGPYPYYGYGYGYSPAYTNTGEVKIETKVKDAQVFINGAYAGTTHDNKTMHLRPGSYTISIREGERPAYTETVYVSLGKTVHLYPAL